MNIMNAMVPYAAGEISFEDAAEAATKLFEKSVIENTFVCDVCGKIISPQITANEHGIFVECDCTEIRGGKINEVFRKCVCQECKKHLHEICPEFESR